MAYSTDSDRSLDALVRRVVEDVHVRGARARSSTDAVDEPLERGLLGVGVVRPDALVAAPRAPPAPEVLDAPVADVGVALEVEEDVARAGLGQERVAGGALRARGGGASARRVSRDCDLQRGLVVEELEALAAERARVDVARCVGERAHGRDAAARRGARAGRGARRRRG